MLYLQIASPKSSVLNFLDSNSFEVIISIFQRTEKVPDMERLHRNVEDIKIVSVDGLTRFGDTIDVVFPPTEIQRPSGTLHYEVCELQRFQALCKGFERSLSGCNR